MLRLCLLRRPDHLSVVYFPFGAASPMWSECALARNHVLSFVAVMACGVWLRVNPKLGLTMVWLRAPRNGEALISWCRCLQESGVSPREGDLNDPAIADRRLTTVGQAPSLRSLEVVILRTLAPASAGAFFRLPPAPRP